MNSTAPRARGSGDGLFPRVALRYGPLAALCLAAGTAIALVRGHPAKNPAHSTAAQAAELPAATPNTAPRRSPALPAAPLAPPAVLQNPQYLPYDGAFAFVRVRFQSRNFAYGGGFGRGGSPGWAHDYPYADENFIKILDELSLLDVNLSGTSVIDADDPELHRHPIAYVSEPGGWTPSQAEIDNIAAYLVKGGFLILDDFRGNAEWSRVEAIFQEILPGHRFEVLDIDEPIFDSFFEIETLDLPPPTFRQYTPVFLGIHEDNDPSGRLMVIANFNNDIGDYWEYSDLGYVPIELSNEAYKFGVNYVIYALIH